MRRARRLGLVALGILLGLWAVGSVDLRPHRAVTVTPLAPVRLPGPLSAGFAAADLTPTHPLPLGGFGSRHGADFTTVRDRVFARALVLAGGGHRVGLVSLDVVLVPPPLAAAIAVGARRQGIDRVVVAATHTHNGPGGLWDDPLAELIGMGRYHPAYARRVVRETVAALARAAKGAVPVRLRLGTGTGPAVCRSRDPGRHPDRRLTVLEVDPAAGGPPLGRVVVFACHPTVLGAHDHRLSAGWPGVLARHLTGTTVFLQGAVGDVTSERLPGAASKDARMAALGAAVAAAVRALPLRPAVPGGVRLGAATVALPAPTGDTVAPPGLRHLAGNLLVPFAPRRARVWALTVGDLTLAMLPGEPVSPLAARWTRALSRRTGGPVRVVGLAGGYLGYLETKAALAARRGESRQAYFGPRAVAALREGLRRALPAPAAAPSPAAPAAPAAPSPAAPAPAGPVPAPPRGRRPRDG